MRSLVASVTAFFTVLFCSRRELLFEIAALRQQVAVLSASGRKPKLHPSDRVFWVVLSRLWARWESVLHIVKPRTVIAWHKKGFRLLWTWKSRRGRPRIEREHRVLIRQLSRDNPSWGENRIADELRQKLGVEHAASTVRRYMHRPKNDPGDRRRSSQNWRTFLKNHGNEIYACDFVTQYTATFQVVYVFVVMQLGTRRVIHANVTASPSLVWVKTQLRDICAFGAKPRFLIHDNDGIFGQFGRRRHGCRCNLDLWLKRILGVEGIPTPYHAPNANAVVERFNLSLRREALDHFVFFSEHHVRRVVREYITFYNRARPSQAINAIPDPYDELRTPPEPRGRVVELPVLGGVHHDYRRAA